jgi:DnaJ-domain-containing protein 1
MVCAGCVTKAAQGVHHFDPDIRGWNRPTSKKKSPLSDYERHLKTLGLAPGASSDVIKSKWRELAIKHHPDRAPEKRRAVAEKKMRSINEAYQWLLAHPEAA